MSELNFDFYIENDIIEKNNFNLSLLNDYTYFTGLHLLVLHLKFVRMFLKMYIFNLLQYIN